MAKRKETVIDVPADLVEKCNGLSLDFGTTMIKATYRAKKDWEEFLASNEKPAYGKLRITAFQRDECQEMIDMLKKESHISRQGDKPTKVTGMGVCQTLYAKDIQEALNVELTAKQETDMSVIGFVYIAKHFSLDQIRLNLEPEAIQLLNDLKDNIMKSLTSDEISEISSFFPGVSKDNLLDTVFKQIDQLEVSSTNTCDEPGMFPAIVVTGGSAILSAKIHADGRYSYVELSYQGGRTLLGLGKLLVGADSYDELMDLATRGNYQALDCISLSDIVGNETDQGNPAYSSFGNATGRSLDDFRREDVAMAFVNMMCNSFSHDAYAYALYHGCNHVFWSGGIFNHYIVRTLVAKEFLLRNYLYTDKCEKPHRRIQCHAIKNGQFLTSLGALTLSALE